MIQTLIFSYNCLYGILEQLIINHDGNEMAGRKPKYDKAMTGAEKAREYRERKKAQGEKLVYFALDDKIVKAIDEVVEFFELQGRGDAVWALLKRPLKQAVRDIAENKILIESLEVGTEADEEAIKLAKQIIWDSLTD